MRGLAALALALLPGLAVAETDEGCAALLSQGAALIGMTVEGTVGAVQLPTVLFGEVAGTLPWCEATGVVAQGEEPGRPGLRIDRLRWRGLDPLLDGALPTEVWAEMEGLRLSPQTGDPVVDWLLAERAGPEGIDGSLEAGSDPADGSLRLHALHVGFPDGSAVDLTLDTAGLDLASVAALQSSLGRAGITELSASVTTVGLFEGYVLLPLYSAVLDGSQDPENDAERFRVDLIARAGELPETIFRGPTRGALAALAAALPHPRGTLRLDARVEEGAPLGVPRLAGLVAAGEPALLDGVAVTATWEPLAP